ncbi:MAG: ribonuclease D [Pseudomonadales bacterium]
MEAPWHMPCKADAASVSWITTDAELAEAAAGWSSVIGLDTEFQRTDTFFPLPGLYQISSGTRVFLVDPLSVADWSPVLELLEDPRVTKILHACSEDLELMRHHIGAVPMGLFDTQLARAFLSPDYSMSYTRLLEAELEIRLEQHETRSNWLARPLSEQQLRYAWEDVYYLPPLHQKLKARLEATGRAAWFREEMDRRGRFVGVDPEQYYLNVKKAWRLPGDARRRLQALCAWRERQAMAEDRPRGRIVRDEHLLALAGQTEACAHDVFGLLPRPVARRYVDDLLAAHAQGNEPGLHPPPAEAPLRPAQVDLVRRLRDVASARAEALGLSPELLARKREVEACVRSVAAGQGLTDAYRGWRQQALAGEFFEILASTGPVNADAQGG